MLARRAEDHGYVAVLAAEGYRLAKVLKGTRKLSTGGRLQPIGITINFSLSLTGFRGRKVDVRWELYDARGGGHVPLDWLANQRAFWLKGQAERDTASLTFWVPLPQVTGRFFVRLGVYDDNDTRLAYADTPRFD